MTTTTRPRQGWHPTALLLVLSVGLATVGNLPFWNAVWRLPETHGLQAALALAAWALMLCAATLALLGLVLWPRWLKPAGLVLLALTAVSNYFMGTYGIVIDPGMLANVLQTDTHEVLDLASWPLAATLVVGVVLPGIWWWRQALRPVQKKRLVAVQLGCVLVALAAAVLLLWASFQDAASLMRNHKQLRYMINPFNTVYALGRTAAGRSAHAGMALQAVGSDARYTGPLSTPDTAPLIVLVVGETARAANFGLGGYARETTPRLAQLQAAGDMVYFTDVSACGTSTQVSVPCMFSPLGRKGFESASGPYENLLDVLQRAGLAVLWIDNQSGCKGVCARVPTLQTRDLPDSALCPQGQCYDDIMLRQLPAVLTTLDAKRRARATVVVMHQMGSHGPAYYQRSGAALKAFTPECTSHALQDCRMEHIQNAYDNSLRATDQFLADTVQWLQAQARPSALVYVSDHGESLGEKGLYLHGMPYALAPTEQTHVPMLVWMSKTLQQTRSSALACLRQQQNKPLSHDVLFPTVLDLAGVQTTALQAPHNLLAACPGTDSAAAQGLLHISPQQSASRAEGFIGARSTDIEKNLRAAPNA